MKQKPEVWHCMLIALGGKGSKLLFNISARSCSWHNGKLNCILVVFTKPLMGVVQNTNKYFQRWWRCNN